MGNKGNVMKVVELGLQDRVYSAMKQQNFSIENLTRILNDEGIDITSQSIRKFINNTRKAQAQIIQKDLNAATEYKKLTMDYSKALKDILTEVEEVKNSAKNEKDYATYNQLVGRLMQGIELIAKLTGDIKPAQHVDIKIIYNEISNDIQKKMSTLRKELFDDKIIDIDTEIIDGDKKQSERLNN